MFQVEVIVSNVSNQKTKKKKPLKWPKSAFKHISKHRCGSRIQELAHNELTTYNQVPVTS